MFCFKVVLILKVLKTEAGSKRPDAGFQERKVNSGREMVGE
jgi:hypothetical protein